MSTQKRRVDVLMKAGLSRREALKFIGAIGAAAPLASLLPATALGQSTETPKYGGVLVGRVPADPAHYDPLASSSSVTLFIVAACYNSLIRMDPYDPDNIIGDLATDWSVSDDGLEYTFNIIQNAKFHDGVPLTAQDVKFTFDRVRNPPEGIVSVRRNLLAGIKEIQTPDDYTVKFVLEYPKPSLIDTLAMGFMVVIPKHTTEEKGDLKETVNGSGPYTFKEHIRGVSYEMVRNPNYHVEGKPYLDGVKYFIVPDIATTVAYMRSSQIIIFENPGGPVARQVEAEFPELFNIYSADGYLGESFTMNALKAPFDDVRVRKAFVLTVDRDEGLKIINQGDGVVGGLMKPGFWSLTREEVNAVPGYGTDYEANRAEARQLLAEAGYPDGLEVTLLVRRANTTHEERAIFLADQFSKIGVKTNLDLRESADYLDVYGRRDFTIACSSLDATAGDPDNYFADHHTSTGAYNFAGISSPEMDELILQQSRMVDRDARRLLVRQIEEKALLNYGLVVMCFRKKYSVVSKRIQNYVMHYEPDNNHRLDEYWLA